MSEFAAGYQRSEGDCVHGVCPNGWSFVSGNIFWFRAKVLSANRARQLTGLKRPGLRPFRDGGGVRDSVDPANPARPGQAILFTAS